MTLAGSRLLVVDDEPVLLLTFSLLLKQAGASVLQAANGAEALRLVRQEQVDLILCDRQMPVMDGMTFLRHVRDEQLSVPTLLFTNGIEREDTAELEAMQVRRLLTKPIQPGKLLAVVAEALAVTA